MRRFRDSARAATCALFVIQVHPAAASDTADVQATIDKWVADFNKGDMKPFLAACAPQAAVIDGFPPYAWQSCSGWMNDYAVNNRALEATGGTLAIGPPTYSEVQGDRAYFIFPATFSHAQKGKPVVYKGSWTMTLHRTPAGWRFTGSSSAWGENSL